MTDARAFQIFGSESSINAKIEKKGVSVGVVNHAGTGGVQLTSYGALKLTF